ncbi:OmpA family protein [Emticicia sp. W12TSBA100-4]|uniref:OmpA family protein n=1 Tax=Emticicia sp. W12TSBA100-4 TaxID=3160965 RepID=UPI003305AA37
MKNYFIIILCTLCFDIFAQIPEKSYAKFDFVPGDKVLFEDNFLDESADEIPSHWIVSGKVEVAKINGELTMGLLDGTPIAYPRLKNNLKRASPQRFTLEFDYLYRHNAKPWKQAVADGNVGGNRLEIQFANNDDYYNRELQDEVLGDFYNNTLTIGAEGIVQFANAKGSYTSGKKLEELGDTYEDLCDKWVHVSIAVTEKSLKVYLNSERVLNAQITKGRALGFQISANTSAYEMAAQVFIKNIRVAEGGADPYKTLSTDGRFIARGINFDVAKAILKPESMGTINTIVVMMKEHTDLKFEIGGHTDADGDDASNLKLSQERADAVKNKLVSLGIDTSRLSTKGYGEAKPIGDNKTFEGKAENRRVEFVKI